MDKYAASNELLPLGHPKEVKLAKQVRENEGKGWDANVESILTLGFSGAKAVGCDPASGGHAYAPYGEEEGKGKGREGRGSV